MNRNPKYDAAKNELCDATGMYDTFTRQDVLRWFPEYAPKMLDNIILQLLKHKVLKRAYYGVYSWTYGTMK